MQCAQAGLESCSHSHALGGLPDVIVVKAARVCSAPITCVVLPPAVVRDKGVQVDNGDVVLLHDALGNGVQLGHNMIPLLIVRHERGGQGILKLTPNCQQALSDVDQLLLVQFLPRCAVVQIVQAEVELCGGQVG